MKNVKSNSAIPKFQHSADRREGKIERAVAIMRDPRGFMQDKWQFLRDKGLTDNEILEALNTASDGELLRAALPELS